MTVNKIHVAFTNPEQQPLGDIWRITSRRTDFYLEPIGQAGIFHLSIHGPNQAFPDGHRFHVKPDHQALAAAERRGQFVRHGLDEDGYAFDGQELALGVFWVARIRWLWDLQRPRYRSVAVRPGPLPSLSDNRSGARLSALLPENGAADLDLVVSYNQPYWPGGQRSLDDNARLGPLRNDAGMWLTATSYHRSQTRDPTPQGLVPPLPKADEDPCRMLCGGPDPGSPGGVYWLVEAITSLQILEASQPTGDGSGDLAWRR